MAARFEGGEAPVSNKLIPSGGRAFRDVNFLANLGCDGCARYAYVGAYARQQSAPARRPWLLTPLAVPGTERQKQKSSLRVYELE
jgi:hypothetical protein